MRQYITTLTFTAAVLLGLSATLVLAGERSPLPAVFNDLLDSKMKQPTTPQQVAALDKQLKNLVKQADGIRGACVKISENNYCRTHKIWCVESRKQLTRSAYLKFSGECANERAVRGQAAKHALKLAKTSDRAALKNLGERLRRLAFAVLKQGYDQDSIGKYTTLLADVDKASASVQNKFNVKVKIERHNLSDERAALTAILERVATMETACLAISDNNYCVTHSNVCDAARVATEQTALDANSSACHVGGDLRVALSAIAIKLDSADERQQLADLGEYVWRVDRDALENKYDRSGMINSQKDLDKATSALQVKLGQ